MHCPGTACTTEADSADAFKSSGRAWAPLVRFCRSPRQKDADLSPLYCREAFRPSLRAQLSSFPSGLDELAGGQQALLLQPRAMGSHSRPNLYHSIFPGKAWFDPPAPQDRSLLRNIPKGLHLGNTALAALEASNRLPHDQMELTQEKAVGETEESCLDLLTSVNRRSQNFRQLPLAEVKLGERRSCGVDFFSAPTKNCFPQIKENPKTNP